MALHAYPFDSQVFPIVLQAQDFDASEVRLVASAVNMKSLLPEANIDGWEVVRSDVAHLTKEYIYSEESMSRVVLSVHVRRHSGQLVNRYVVGVSLLVFMAIFAVTLEPNNPNRQTMQQSSFLGVVAWQYVLVSSTPDMGYLTSLDKFFMVSFGHIFATFAYCSVKHGYAYWLDELVAANRAHFTRHSKRSILFAEAAAQAEREPAPVKQQQPIPGLWALACVIARGLPGYVCGGAWAGMNLHHRMDLLAMVGLTVSFVATSAYALLIN
jgi:hypothetical protein